MHFYSEQQIKLFFNSHFLHIDNEIYYEDLFVNENIVQIVKNNNSNDVLNFNNIISKSKYTNLCLDKAIIFFVNTSSPGHEFASLIETIYLYYTNNLFDYDIIISDKIYFFGQMFTSILDLFFDKSKIKIIDNNTIVNINQTYLFKTYSSKQHKCINFLLNKLNENLTKNVYENLNKNVYENLCIIKTTTNKTFNSQNKSFSEDYNLFFEKYGFKIIKPEDLSVYELHYLIKNCKNIILSWGANSYCNSSFVNETHNVITLCHINYNNEYNNFKKIQNIEKYYSDWTPICNKNIMLYDLETELTETIKQSIIPYIKDLH
jgi:hypothetical protein